MNSSFYFFPSLSQSSLSKSSLFSFLFFFLHFFMNYSPSIPRLEQFHLDYLGCQPISPALTPHCMYWPWRRTVIRASDLQFHKVCRQKFSAGSLSLLLFRPCPCFSPLLIHYLYLSPLIVCTLPMFCFFCFRRRSVSSYYMHISLFLFFINLFFFASPFSRISFALYQYRTL